MFVRNYFVALGVVLAAMGTTLTAAPHVFAIAPQEQAATSGEKVKSDSGAVEVTTASLIADIHLPEGTVRATGAGDLANFNKALQEAAKNNQGRITNSEVLVWTGDTAKSVMSDISGALKQSGYMVAEVTPFDSEVGTITPLAAQRGSKADRIIGLWIEAKTGEKMLVWGRMVEAPSPSAVAASSAQAAKPVIAAKKSVAAANKAEAERIERVKSVMAAKARLEKQRAESAKRSYSSSSSSAAKRQMDAFKAYKDYQWTKYNAPYTGSMYGSKW